jgi:hypothetical protein
VGADSRIGFGTLLVEERRVHGSRIVDEVRINGAILPMSVGWEALDMAA